MSDTPRQSRSRCDYELIDAITAFVECNPEIVALGGWDRLSLAFHSHPAAHVDRDKRTVAAVSETQQPPLHDKDYRGGPVYTGTQSSDKRDGFAATVRDLRKIGGITLDDDDRELIQHAADLIEVLAKSTHSATPRAEVIEEVAKHVEGASLTYFGPDPGGVQDLRFLIVAAIRGMKGV